MIRVPSASRSLVFELRIAEDGEIQVKGASVFPKYHKNGEATEDSFTEDGWYKTGDLGRIDDDGFLYIIGRKKTSIITAGGKNVSPGPIEDVIKRCEFVSQALVLGDKRPFISALITLDEEALRPWLESEGSQTRYVDGGGLQQRGRPRRSPEVGRSANEGVSVPNPCVSSSSCGGVHTGERFDDRFHEGHPSEGDQSVTPPC